MQPTARRSAQRAINIWPGWVDALSSLIMVIIFMLLIFVVAQFFLANALTGRDQALMRLTQRVDEVSGLLTVERQANADLQISVTQLSDQLQQAMTDREEMASAIRRFEQERATLVASVEALTGRSSSLATRLDSANSGLAEAASVLEENSARIDRQMREIASLQGDVQALRAVRAELEGDVAELAQVEATLRGELDRLDRQLVAAVLAGDELRVQLDAAEQREVALRDQVTLSDQKRQILLERIAGLDTALEAERAQVVEAQEALRLSDADRAELRTVLSDLRARLGESDGARGAMAERVAAAERAQAGLAETLALSQARTEDLIAEMRDLRQALQAAEDRGAVLAEEVRLTERQRQAVLHELGTVRDRTMALETRLAEAQERTMLAQRRLEARAIRIADLEQIVAATRAEHTQEQKESDAARTRSEALSDRIAQLQEELARLTAALQESEATVVSQRMEIGDLGQRLNLALASRVEELAAYRSEFFGRLRGALGNRDEIRVVGDRFVFQSEVLFASGSATLEAAGERQLEGLARTLLEISRTIPTELDWILRVDGHTDRRPINSPRFPSNWELSAARAISVVKHLIERGISAERLAAAGFGEFQPIDAGISAAALARNRRIELRLDQR